MPIKTWIKPCNPPWDNNICGHYARDFAPIMSCSCEDSDIPYSRVVKRTSLISAYSLLGAGLILLSKCFLLSTPL